MNSALTLSRRQALRWLSGSSLLPLAGGNLLSGCGGGDGTPTPSRNVQRVQFTGMAAPNLRTPAAMATTTVASTLQVIYDDGSAQRYALGYQPLFITGDRVKQTGGGTVITGGCFNIHGQAISDTSVSGEERQFFSDCPDGTSLLAPLSGTDKTTLGVSGNPVFAVVQFEYVTRDQSGRTRHGRLPSPIAVLTLDQNPSTGALKLVSYHNVDTSPAYGLWITCGASLSPWNTHLSSEEYEPDAFTIANDAQFRAYINALYGDDTAADDPTRARPYRYGHLPEITVQADGTATVKKHFCLGRISHELVQVCPDNRTVLMGDDATNGGAFMFIADKEKDLSAGTLYVAKWTQTSGTGPGAGTLRWIRLGHARSDAIEALANSLDVSDIFDIETTDPADSRYTAIRFAGHAQWVRLQPGMEQAAAFLETHRYAALKGGSLGFTKWEGTTVNADDKVAYVAMSYIHKSMTDGTTDIHVEKNQAGAVYALNLRGSQTDTTGQAIDSEWVPVDMAPPAALVGETLSVADALGNTANADKIANPDNLKFSAKLRTLFIGEDSANHVNNFLWAYHVDTKQLSRLLSCPAGAESTGLQGVDDVNGWVYIMSNCQHPGDWESPLHDVVQTTLDPLIRANYKERFGGAVGYLTGLPQSDAA